MHRLVALSLVMLVPTLARAQAETLQLTFETSESGAANGDTDYRPSNLVVVWLERQSDGAHVATIARWGVAFAHNLRDWVGVSEFGTDGINLDNSKPVDGLTEASQRCYTGQVFDLNDVNADGCGYLPACGTCTLETMPALLDTGAVDISGIPDGDYTIEMELADWELPSPSGNGRTSIPFTKDGTASTPAASDLSTFSNISVVYTGRPGTNYQPGVYAGPDRWVTPTTTATDTLAGTVTDAAAPTITWSVINPPASSCVSFTAADTATTDVSFCADGIYVLGLSADDGSLSTRDEVIVYVNAEVVTPAADAQVNNNDATTRNTNYGTERFMWTNLTNRIYMRFDTASITDTITAARLQFHGVESIYTDDDRIIRLFADDTWGETTITWNNQPLTNGNGTAEVLAGSYLAHFGLNRVDLATTAVQHARFTDGAVSLFISHETSPPEWMGMTTKETHAPPELIVVKAWAETNSAPTAVANVPASAVADAAGSATVSLDGSGSTDADGNITLWEWREGVTAIASGETTTAALGLGLHAIDLYVEDSLGLNDTDAGNQVLVDDRYLGNDASGAAQMLTAGTYDHLFAHDAAGDWFLVTLSADGGLDVDIAFSHADGDLNLHVYQSDGSTLVDESVTTTDDESTSISGLTAGDYLVHVTAVSGNAIYAATIAVTGAPILSVSFSPTEVLESAGTVANIGTVTVDVAPSADLSVTLSSSFGDLAPESPVLILSGQTSVTFDVTVTDDSIEEADANATVTANATAHTAGAGDLTIRDDDGPLPIVSWSSAAQTVSETASTATVTVNMTATSANDVVVPFTLSGTATGGGVDYLVGSTDITIPTGDTSADLTFVLFDDSGLEGDETVVFTLGIPTGATTTSPLVHLVTLTDDETPVADGAPSDGGPTGDSATGDQPGTGDSSAQSGDTQGRGPIILESTGCACDQTGTPGGMLLLLLVAWRRRR